MSYVAVQATIDEVEKISLSVLVKPVFEDLEPVERMSGREILRHLLDRLLRLKNCRDRFPNLCFVFMNGFHRKLFFIHSGYNSG
jgi:hypothetical protein